MLAGRPNKLNLLSCQLDESLDEAGFRHEAAAIGHRIGAERIGAGLYQAVSDHPIWPYHYHYSTEEWMYVISGAPVLRDAGGQRTLQSGDLVCFPPNHRGAHTVCGPGRLIIFSTNESSGPWVSVYPDSDKIGVSPGVHETTSLNALRLPRSGAVDYWYGEGTADSPDPVEVQREPAGVPSRPVINVLTVPLSDAPHDVLGGFRFRAAPLGPELGGAGFGATVVELDPGEGSAPYQYQHGREEWALVLAGAPTLRHPGGEDVLQVGDLVCFPEGPDGAHRLINHSEHVVRAILLSTQGLPASICFPDSGTWTLALGPEHSGVSVREVSGPDATGHSPR